ncbi:PH domain-containing protein [Nocardioides acrostichi]|uniref:PH domain-containing protein n=1 Tax=Nocardioides acrostichi TaxID=2784339 RepID=UPI002E2B30D9|nr:PH domain-containing protein [Nocardioides acrostichi]
MSLPVTWRPLGGPIVGVVLGVGLLVVFGAAWFAFDDETRGKFTAFQIGTMLVLGALGFACLHALIRSRVVASRDGLLIVNGYRKHQLAYEQVVDVHLSPGAPWVTLDLSDGTTLSVLGIQGSDGRRAVRAARALRALVVNPPSVD